MSDAPNIGVYSAPWVSGTRADGYFGEVQAELFVPDTSIPLEMRIEAAEAAVLDEIRAKAAELGANSITGCEITVVPHASREVPGMLWGARGTAALLRPVS